MTDPISKPGSATSMPSTRAETQQVIQQTIFRISQLAATIPSSSSFASQPIATEMAAQAAHLSALRDHYWTLPEVRPLAADMIEVLFQGRPLRAHLEAARGWWMVADARGRSYDAIHQIVGEPPDATRGRLLDWAFIHPEFFGGG